MRRVQFCFDSLLATQTSSTTLFILGAYFMHHLISSLDKVMKKYTLDPYVIAVIMSFVVLSHLCSNLHNRTTFLISHVIVNQLDFESVIE